MHNNSTTIKRNNEMTTESRMNGFSDLNKPKHNGMSLISHLTSSFLAAANQNNKPTQLHRPTNHSLKRNSLTRNSSVNDEHVTSYRNSTSSSSSITSFHLKHLTLNQLENDSVFEESSISSNSNQRIDDLKPRNYDEDDDLAVDDVFDDIDDEVIIIKKSDFNNTDDLYNASNCNLSKLKLKQENIEFLNLIKKCQNWIETTTAKKFAYPNDFRKSLENGVLLCELLNVLKKDCIRRINRFTTPIAGIDNLNVFLKACQQNFQLVQSNLFDIIDLEDLNKRRGNTNKDSNDSTDETTTNHSSNNQSKEIDTSNATNENILDEEQQKRLKKVVNTIYWLSRKAIELGIPLAYHFDTNNSNNSTKTSSICNNSTKTNTFYYSSNSNLSLNQYSSSTSSSLSSSSSFIASISSVSSTSTSSNNTNNLLSVIVSTPLPQPATNFKLNSAQSKTAFLTNINAPSNNNPQLLLKKKYNNKIKSLEEIDSINENLNTNMSYIYKQPSQLSTTKLQLDKANSRRSSSIQIESAQTNRKDSIDADSFTNSKLINPSAFTSSPSSFSSPGSTTNQTVDSQDDLQLIDSTMSPISSSTTNSALSPHLISSTSSSTNLSNSNLAPKVTQINQIPTRFVDRRVSTCVNQTYKFNYQEAGQRMARKAQEQLKTVERCKEDEAALEAANKARMAEISAGGGSIGDDWQNVCSSVDDWKKRRREKQKMPPPRIGQNGELDEDEQQQQHCGIKSDRKRINKFENSHYYIPTLSESNNLDDLNEIIEQNSVEIKPIENLDEKENFKIKKNHAATIEVSGIRNISSNQAEPKEKESKQIKHNTTNETNQPSDDISINQTDFDTSICNTNHYQYTYIEKVIDLNRTDDYNLRGFGFLLKNGSNNTSEKLNQSNQHILCQNYAEIVGLDPHSLADKAGLKKGDLVIKINEFATSNLSSEQLRKIMKDRLKMNSIQLTIFSLEKQEINTIEEENIQQIKEDKPLELVKTSTKSLLLNKSIQQQQYQDYHQIVAPKPFRKSLPSSVSTSTLTSSSNQNFLQTIPSAQQNSREKSSKQNLANDDTDHDNDDVDSDEFLLPPPVPATDPPPLPGTTLPADLIKKELKDNMKCVENWKIEQEILMKRKYQEEQKRIEQSLRIDLEKVKEEENQRREQLKIRYHLERLKLEKEKLRLQELELKEREQELKESNILNGDQIETDHSTKFPKHSVKQNETVRKEDLSALIEKIYTEQEDESNFLIEYTQPPTASPVKVHAETLKPALKSPTSNKPSTIVMTKTSPIVAAALSCDEEDLYLIELNKKSNERGREIFTDLIDTTTKHQIIKQVHDSMDNLKNQLLHKGMSKYADDVDNLNKNLDATRKKQEELERIKREQEQIKIEKERIEQEKEKLRQEAEQLRLEREMILMAATTKAAAMSATPPSSSSSSSTTMNEQLESEYYRTSNYMNDAINSLTMSHSSSSLSPPRKYYDKNQVLLSQPQSWLIEEVERKRMTSSINQPQNYVEQQGLRRSYPNLLIDSNYNQSNFISTPLTSSTGMTKIYSKKKSVQTNQPNSRPIKIPQLLTRSNINTTNNSFYTSAKPPQSNHRLISNSSNDLKNVVKLQKNVQQPLSTSSTTLSSIPQAPVISLNQKCSSCSQALGQGSAMFIEKLSLAFHLKCFRCTVCNVPLGNGKEGTDVRVSVANRLHCNNCFSNDLGMRLSAV